MERLFIATEEDIRQGRTMDVYFQRSLGVLKALDMEETRVKAEFSAGSLPAGWPWAIICGTEEVLRLMEGLPVDLYGIPEGTLWRPRSYRGPRIPFMNIEGPYCGFGEMETSILGMLCHSSGVATKAARCKMAAEMGHLMAFGNRRMHPALAPMLDRSAFIGGCDGVASPLGAELIGEEALGTVPHALILMIGDEVKAYQAFNDHSDADVPRIVLVDTFSDERFGALEACRSIPGLEGIRLDTPGSRRGSFRELVQEVRWEMDMAGHHKVRIIATGGLDEDSIRKLKGSGVDSFGVGTSISNAPTVDFSMDLVEKDGVPISKRGKFSGRKYPFRCPACLLMDVSLDREEEMQCECGAVMEMIEVRMMENGRRTIPAESAKHIRNRVLEQLQMIHDVDNNRKI